MDEDPISPYVELPPRLQQAAILIKESTPIHEGELLVEDPDGRVVDAYFHAREYMPGDEITMVTVLEENGIDALQFAISLNNSFKITGGGTIPEKESQIVDPGAFDHYRRLCVCADDLVTAVLLQEEVDTHNRTISEVKKDNPAAYYSRHYVDMNSPHIVAVYKRDRYENDKDTTEILQAADSVMSARKIADSEPTVEHDKEFLRAEVTFAKMYIQEVLEK